MLLFFTWEVAVQAPVLGDATPIDRMIPRITGLTAGSSDFLQEAAEVSGLGYLFVFGGLNPRPETA